MACVHTTTMRYGNACMQGGRGVGELDTRFALRRYRSKGGRVKVTHIGRATSSISARALYSFHAPSVIIAHLDPGNVSRLSLLAGKIRQRPRLEGAIESLSSDGSPCPLVSGASVRPPYCPCCVWDHIPQRQICYLPLYSSSRD